MKYPFTPELLDALPEELEELFRALEITLLEEICSRLKAADELNEVTVQDIRALRSHGIDLKKIRKEIQKTADIGEEKLNKLLDDVVERNQRYYNGLITLADVTKPDRLVDASDIDAIRRQTLGEFRNLTQSLGFLVDNGQRMLPPAQAYQWALNSSTLQIQSGAISYNQAIANAVKQLAESGIKVVDYESGHTDQIDVAARRAVMTGVAQICDKYSDQSAEYLDTRYFEITAHSGARDKPGPSPWSSHKDWQGKIYYKSENGEPDPLGQYKDLVETTGYGYVDGLTGANCRHYKHAYIPGVMEPTYSEEQLEHIDDGLGCEFDGKKYTAYEATQMQRRLERSIRKQKRLKNAYKASGQKDKETAAAAKLRRLNTKYHDFSKAAGLPEQPERTRVLYTDAKSEAAASKAKTVERVEPPTNTEPAESAGFQPRYTDVTEKWRAEATPNSHTVQDLQEYTANGVTYKVDGHNVVLDHTEHEKEIAGLLEKEFGGEIGLVPRVNNPQGVSTPDYIFRGEAYDLKTLGEKAGGNTIFNRVKKAAKQGQRFILDVTKTTLDEKTIDAQIEKIFARKDTEWVDEIIEIRNGKVQRIVKRK